MGTCDVSVRMSLFAVSEASSWDDVKIAAARLNEACRVEKTMGNITGGAVGVGEHEWIRIWIGRKGDGGESEVDGRAG